MIKAKKAAASSKDAAAFRMHPDLPSEFSPVSSDEAEALSTAREWSLAERSLSGVSFATTQLSKFTAESCVFEQVSFNEAKIESMRCKDVVFANCDLANLHVRKLFGTRIEFKNCRLTGVRLIESESKDLLISGGDERYAQFRFSTIESAEFEGCNFEESDFYGAKLKRVKFSGCNLRSAEMSDVTLTEVDLRGSTVEGLKVKAEDIRGAIVDPGQALAFAHLLGIRIC
ncbi:MAG TPA: pentapeptide repeat-containing protein [Bryobacteraceae bacterium]|nr:pentapeptide repeat-containing protein [Bryobacteraceae bacterium]